MRKDGPSFQRWGITPLEDCKHVIRDYITRFTVSQPSTWMEIYTGLTLDPVQNVIARNPRACVRWKEMVKSFKNFFRVEDLPKGFHLQDPSHLRQEEPPHLWTF